MPRWNIKQQQVEPQSAPSQRVDYAPAAPSYTPAAPRYGPAAPRSDYVPASAPAFAQDRQDLGPGGLEAAVAAGAGSFAPNAVSIIHFRVLSKSWLHKGGKNQIKTVKFLAY